MNTDILPAHVRSILLDVVHYIGSTRLTKIRQNKKLLNLLQRGKEVTMLKTFLTF